MGWNSSFHQDFPISWGMRIVFLFAILISALTASVQAHARAPKSENEKSLLYWRYLCENQPQIEKPVTRMDDVLELKCPEQGWAVKALGDTVQEVMENAK
jgi:hypothetical protein